jgi:CheY-like chemotaxis protein
MSDESEHRDGKRVLVHLDVIINGILKATSLDISEEGMYISTQAELLTGAVLELNFKIDQSPITVKAVVQHGQPGIGVGVKFLNLIAEHVTLIKKFIERTDTPAARKPGRKILLVDDSAQSRSIYMNRLNLEGFSVIEASNGVEALKQLQDATPDLVVLDLWMEGIDGFKILQLMHLNPNFKDIPVIVLSARSVPSDIQRAIALGARDYLPKMTTTPLKLAEKVKAILWK